MALGKIIWPAFSAASVAFIALITGCASPPAKHTVLKGYTLETLVPGSPMHGVHGLAFDKNDTLYGASLTGYSIYQIDTESGEVTTKVGPPLGNADDVAVAPDGTIAWTAGAFSAIHALTPEGEIKVLANNLPAVNSINYSPDGRLFITRVFGGDALYEIDPAGEAAPREIAKKLGGLNGFEVTADMQLYGPLFLKGKLVRVDLESGEVFEIADGFKVPAAVNLDSKGRLFAVDFRDGTITRMNLDSSERTIIATLEPPLDNLAINSQDEIYVSNPATNTITAVDPESGATRVVTQGEMGSPGGISIIEIDGASVVLLADAWGNRYFNAETGLRTMLSMPEGVTASASLTANDEQLVLASIWPFGLVYVIDRAANKILKTAKFDAPYSPVFLEDGSILVADYKAGTVTRLAPGKSRDKQVLISDLSGPVGLAIGDQQTVYISEYDSGQILAVDLTDGSTQVLVKGLIKPEGLAMMSDGQLLIAETGTQSVLRMNVFTAGIDVVADNLAIGLVGGEDLPLPFLPTGIAVDAAENIYISADIDNALYKLTRQ
jgi:sugar lactone lactonase YvrE